MNSNPHRQRSPTAPNTSPYPHPGTRPRRRASCQTSSPASAGSHQVHRHQYRFFMPRCTQGAQSTAAAKPSPAVGPKTRPAAAARQREAR